MSGYNESRSRRTVLKALPAGVVSSAAIGVTSGNNGSGEEAVDTSFNPDNGDEVKKFVAKTFEKSDHIKEKAATSQQAEERIKGTRERIVDELSEKQLQAVSEVLSNADYRFERSFTATKKSSPTTEVQASDVWEYTEITKTASATVDVPGLGEYDAFDYTQEVEWEYKPLEGVRNINAIGDGNGEDYIAVHWSYDKDQDEDITIRQDGNYFTSDMTGVFDGCLLVGTSWTCSRTDRLYTRVNGNWNGTGKLVDSEVR